MKYNPSYETQTYAVAAPAARETVAAQIDDMARRASQTAEKVATSARERLASISRVEEDCEDRATEPQEQWPPLFSSLRDSLRLIENRLEVIADALDRAEV